MITLHHVGSIYDVMCLICFAEDFAVLLGNFMAGKAGHEAKLPEGKCEITLNYS